jgi:hypothetical protein
LITDPYQKVAEGAINWITANLNKFDFREERGSSLIAELKPLGELALASKIVLLNQHDPTEWKIKSKEWLSYCWSQLHEGEILRKAIETRKDFLLFTAMYAPFRQNDLINEQLEHAVRSKMETSALSQQYPSWILLLIIRTLHVLGIDSPWKIDVCFRNTSLYQLPDVWTIRGFPSYVLTHTVFFLTDFGCRHQDLPEIHRQYLILNMPLWLEHYRITQNFDLFAEMIMVARCIRMEDQKDWGSVLLARQQRDGMVPTARMKGDKSDSEAERFRHHYHSTLTALMASVMSLNVPSRAVLGETGLNPMS